MNPTSSYGTDTSRWEAVCDRTAAANGIFVYAVRTTGIYCRPTCVSRRPRRNNVEFFATPAEANRAGYRACKRCQPDAAVTVDDKNALIEKACELIAQSEEQPNLQTIANAVGLSPYHFHRLFKSRLGITPREYAEALKTGRLQQNLGTASNVTDAIYAAGFESSSRVYAQAADRLGMTPGTFRRGGKGERVRYGIALTDLGRLLVAATDKGICTIAFGDSEAELEQLLGQRFPAAEIQHGGADLEEWIGVILRYLKLPSESLDLPLDIRGTAFQQRVWKALRRIPLGTTATYAEVAAAIDQPSAVRAVANACGSNRLAVAIPCHRVVRSDGGFGGYRWGVARKQWLLDNEATVKARSE